VSNMVAKLTAGALFTSTITQVAFFPGREPAFRCDNPPAKDFHPMLGNTFGYWRYGSARILFCLCTMLTFTSRAFFAAVSFADYSVGPHGMSYENGMSYEQKFVLAFEQGQTIPRSLSDHSNHVHWCQPAQ
jgi:hypothetical protein